MLDASILSVLLLTVLPTQLKPEVMEAAKAQEPPYYYARWIGVRAPELGPNMKDRLDGPAIRLEQLRGNKVLLYSFDAGDFVGGPAKGVFPENLRTLDRVRREVAPDRLAVVGFTAGVMFFFPNVEVPDEIRQLSGFPIVGTYTVARRDAPEPYRMLIRPGGIVIDRNGVIQAIFTVQMTEEQIRAAVTRADWSEPVRPAPIDDPWEGGRPPTPLTTVTKVWSRPFAGVVGLTHGDWDLDGADDLLVYTNEDKMSVLTSKGVERAVVRLETVRERHRGIKRIVQTDGKGLFLHCRGGWPRTVPVHNAEGKTLWEYPETDIGGIDSAAWVDIDGDGSSEMIVGFNGYAGLHLVSNEGKTLWTNTDVKNRWTVSGFDAHGERPGLVLSTGVDGVIRVYDAAGHQVGRIMPDGKPIVTFAAAEMTKEGERQVLFIQEATVGTVDHAVASDLEGNILWRYPIVSIHGSRVPPAIVAADVTGDGTKEWVFQCSKTEVVAVNTEGRLVAQFPTPSAGPMLLTAVKPAATGPELVVLSDGSELVARSVSDLEPTPGSSACPGTVLRIVCDIPDRVGPLARTYPGRIDWPGGSEAFQFRLSKETSVVCLESVVAVNDFARVFFVVDEDPPFATKFKSGEWFYRQRVCFANNAPVPNTLSARLSRFREANDFARKHGQGLPP